MFFLNHARDEIVARRFGEVKVVARGGIVLRWDRVRGWSQWAAMRQDEIRVGGNFDFDKSRLLD